MRSTRDNARRGALGLARGVSSTVSGLVAALVVGFGIPLVWIWIASQVAGTKRDVTPSLAVLITAGILVSYWVVLVAGSWIRGRWVSTDEQRVSAKRMSWNRSFRDEPRRSADDASDPIERLFVIVAVLGIVAFEVWFFFFAGDPLPSQPAF